MIIRKTWKNSETYMKSKSICDHMKKRTILNIRRYFFQCFQGCQYTLYRYEILCIHI